ncbi:unnamed protein product [Microthlaspi erraticum]|uniref:Uncharacterized protein n=1 Tax=Microthlaspi erraticum TaxID=1685480 RepID=A0A6D2JPH4_9BRAS|nr:unnamed protein product [Microthlaspi erraticum]
MNSHFCKRSISSSSSSSDDESQEVKKKKDANKETGGLIDSTAANDPNSEKMIEILSVGGTMVSNEPPPLPKPTETALDVSSGTDSDVKENEGEAASSSLLESNDVPQGSRESEVVISHEEEEEAPVRTHGVAQRTSWLSCCGLFDAMTGSGR